RGHRDVDVEALADASSPLRERAAVARVQAVLVDRYEQNRRVFVEDRLRPVAVVDVPVDDGDLLETVVLLRVTRRDRDVVEEAEAHREVRRRVVPGRPDEGI